VFSCILRAGDWPGHGGRTFRAGSWQLRFIRKFSRGDGGNVAIMLGVSIMPVALAIGGAIDYSLKSQAQAQIQGALDAAVLAGVVAGIPDDRREERMAEAFNGNIDPKVRPHITSDDFDYTPGTHTAHARVSAEIPNSFLQLMGMHAWPVVAESEAVAGASGTRVLDVGMCIDITGSMQSTINAVKAQALSFESELNGELEDRGLPEFNSMRVRVIGYRDFGGNNPAYRSSHYKTATGGYVDKMPSPGAVWRGPGDARNYGDDEPLTASAHFTLPAEASAFAAFVGTLQANGGGDYPEAGLECVNEAMNAAWIKKGDPMPDGSGLASNEVFPMIVVWTDIDAQPLSFSWSLLNPNYPPVADMPRNYTDLEAKWGGDSIDQENKLLVTFMPGSGTPVWNRIKHWQHYFSGGTLAAGNTDMINKIADAIATLPQRRTPTLTQ
jgi:Putative Flp pilus-assembly TadE/G-like